MLCPDSNVSSAMSLRSDGRGGNARVYKVARIWTKVGTLSAVAVAELDRSEGE